MTTLPHRATKPNVLAAAVTALIASLVLIGWTFNLEILKRIIPGLVAMNPMTAVAFLLTAISLASFSPGPSRETDLSRLTLARTCALLIVFIGTARIVAIVGGPDLRIDQWLFSLKLNVGYGVRNVMAPNTALNFFLVGNALVLIHSKNRRMSPFACIAALVCGFESLLAVLGYVFGVGSFYRMQSFIPMALHTAGAFLVVAFGIMACQANRGFLAVITGKNVGGTMARRLLPTAILAPAVLGWLRLEGQRMGFFDYESGVALYTVTNMLVFGLLVACNAYLLFKTDAARAKADLRLRRAHDSLEERVDERTAELSRANADLEKAHAELETRVRDRTASLSETEGRLHAIVENAASIILVKDLDGRIVLANQGFATLVGHTKEQIIGRTNYDFFPKELADEFRAHDVIAVRSGGSTETEETVKRPHGRQTFVANKFPLRNERGEIYALCDISTDITERKRMEDALRAGKRELEAAVHSNQLIMDKSRDVICTVDEVGCFVTVSAACKKLWGYEPAELVGRPYIDLVYAEDRPKTNQVAAEIMAGDAVNDFENRYIRKEGSLMDVMWSAYWSEADRTMFAVAHDVTERTRIQKALQQAKEEAERANRAKSEFLSRMSHELRTPMNAILGFAQLLEMEEITADQRESVEHITRGGRHLLELINEVLDISRIEAGHLSLSPEPVELGDALRETFALVRPLAADREVRLIPPPALCDYYLLADRQRLKQVLINLISNSIKYNRIGGSVAISCEQNSDRARIFIKDTGVGIPAEQLEQLFTPFERLGAEASTIEGTGLGLAVAKRLVEAMDGAIGVESVAGEGTTFWLDFPLTQSPLVRAELTEAETAAPYVDPGEKCSVLYIEDNLSNLRLIERVLLQRPAIELISARDGTEGLKLAQEHVPNLILLDLNLPDMHGHEVLNRLKSDPRCVEIPVLVISADAMNSQKDRMFEAGATGYLTKPLNIKKLLDVLDGSLSGATPARGKHAPVIGP